MTVLSVTKWGGLTNSVTPWLRKTGEGFWSEEPDVSRVQDQGHQCREKKQDLTSSNGLWRFNKMDLSAASIVLTVDRTKNAGTPVPLDQTAPHSQQHWRHTTAHMFSAWSSSEAGRLMKPKYRFSRLRITFLPLFSRASQVTRRVSTLYVCLTETLHGCGGLIGNIYWSP